MSYYPNDFIEQLSLSSDLVALISEDTLLKGKGDSFKGLCPFPEHNEKTPSFSVSAGKQLYHCFGCSNSGNIYTYLQKQRGMDFKTAVEYLANKKGIEIPKQSVYKKNLSQPSYFELTEKACAFFEKQLEHTASDHPVRAYLKKRGWSAEITKTFRMGYAPKNNALVTALKDSKMQKQAVELGFLNRSYKDNSIYDTFRHRLIFPIVSIKKQVIGFGARVLDDSLPKYINSKDSKIFHKGHIFYGLNESARYLRQSSVALVVEGYTDFLSLWLAGFKNTVASLGTAFTEQHAQLLKRYVDTVVLVFDGDAAGLRASERSLPLLLEVGLNVKFLALPKGQDPDDFIKTYGAEDFQKKLDSVQDLFFFVLKQKQTQSQDNLSLIEELSPLLARVKNKALLAIYKQRLLELFGTDASFLEKILDAKIKTAPRVTFSPVKIEKEDLSLKEVLSLEKALPAERFLLALCLESELFLKRFIEEGQQSYLKTKEVVKLFELIADAYSNKLDDFNRLIHLVINKVSKPDYLFKSFYSIFRSSTLDKEEQIFKDCLDTLQKKQNHLEASQVLVDIKMKQKEEMKGLEKLFQLTKQRLNQKENI